jgi:phospholipid-binding lipoprotein MlaA
MVRPYLGPSTLRDAVGSTVDMFSSPIGWLVGPQVAVTVGTAGLDAADRLGQLKQAEDASLDFYSFIRSSYYQMRRAELREALGLPNVVDSPALTDLDDPAPVANGSAPAPDAGRPAAMPDASRSASAAR